MIKVKVSDGQSYGYLSAMLDEESIESVKPNPDSYAHRQSWLSQVRMKSGDVIYSGDSVEKIYALVEAARSKRQEEV